MVRVAREDPLLAAGVLLLVAPLLLSSLGPGILGSGGAPTRTLGVPGSAAPTVSSLQGDSGPRVAPNAATTGSATTWPMFLHDVGRTGANLAETSVNPGNAGSLTPIWWFNSTGAVSGSIAEVNGTAYFGAWDGFLYAVNAYNGSREWRTALPGPGDYTGCGEPGIAGTPAVWNDTVYVGGGNTYLYAVNATTGSVLWHADLANVTGSGSTWHAHKIWSSPVLYHGYLYVGVASGCDSPLVRGALFQIGLSDHTVDHVFWTLPAGQIGPGIWSSPSIDPVTNTVWVTTGNEYLTDTTYARSVVGLNASNISDVLGYAQRAPPFVDYDFGDGATLFHSSNGTAMVVAVNKNGIAYAFNESAFDANGSTPNAWTVTLTASQGNSFVPPAFDGNYLYFGTVDTVLPGGAPVPGSVRCVYPDNGTTRWIVGVGSPVYGGIAYANGLVAVGLTGGGVDLLNASTGDQVFQASTGNVYGEPILVNGELLVPSGVIYGSSAGGSVQAWALPLGATLSDELTSGQAATSYAFLADPSGGIVPYHVSWSFGDGTNASGLSATHAYSAAGSFNVTVTVTDARGTRVVRSVQVAANDPLDLYPTLSVNPVHLGATTWVNVTVVGGGAPFSFDWSGLPPGSPTVSSTTSQILVLPSAEGTYPISVVVNASLGQSARANLTLWVDGPGSLTLLVTPSIGPPPLTVSFQFTTPYVITSAQFAWEFLLRYR
ncbi:MAG: PQQ-binding-like beta-propeller repeat protein, partial [Thermoplasmata archaeon]|nr:PQQ-binding-like beta-propeller repeat protein [Thermoplasmata archaeon]